jgi:hypothetical protein
VTTFITTFHTLEELATHVNRLIETQPENINPESDFTESCVYHSATGKRCLMRHLAPEPWMANAARKLSREFADA